MSCPCEIAKSRLAHTILMVCAIYGVLCPVFAALVQAQTAWQSGADWNYREKERHLITGQEAEQLVWQVPEVQNLAKYIREQGASPFTMVESGDETAWKKGQFRVYFGENHGTHAVRVATFVVNAVTGKVSVYDAVTDTIIPLAKWQADQKPVITMKRTMCYGTCPAYKLAVYRNGTVEYEGKQFVRIKGHRTAFIGKEKVEQLISDFRKARFFSLQDVYENRMTDMPSVILSFTDNGVTKTVIHHRGSRTVPEQLFSLEQKVDTVVNSKQWTGTTARGR